MQRSALAMPVLLLIALSTACDQPSDPPALSSPTHSTGSSAARYAPTADDDRNAVGKDLALAQDFVSFARRAGTSELTARLFDREVELGLGPQLMATVRAEQLDESGAWRLRPAESFRGHTGPFSAVQMLRRHLRSSNAISYFAGAHSHCASPPQPTPQALQGLRQVSIQPGSSSVLSCLDWFTIDLFVTSDDRVRAVTLDVWEP